ncbi:VOC family protein [Micromonospora sp. NPDC049559]|uniref:VOC family protein n=1 Tax=Micromonospora sp. NPDC049559 TaxID=3155923 RepID=UPI0034133F46
MSTMTNGIGWFEIGTEDPAAAERFYGELFGWTFAADTEGDDSSYRMITTPAEGGIGGGILPTGGKMPGYAVFYVVVDDVSETCRRAEAAGGKVLVPPQDNGQLVFAHLLDPAGNHFAVYVPPAGQDA